MQRLEVSGAVRPIYKSLGVKPRKFVVLDLLFYNTVNVHIACTYLAKCTQTAHKAQLGLIVI